MPAHRSQGQRRLETDRHNALTAGVPDIGQGQAGQERRPDGTFAPGALTHQRTGGKTRRGRTKLTHEVGKLPVDDRLKRQAKFMRRSTCSELAATVGAGYCGILASAFVKLGSEDMALREAALATGDVDLARKLGESARSHLLFAREVCAKDGQARPKSPVDPLAAFMPKERA